MISIYWTKYSLLLLHSSQHTWYNSSILTRFLDFWTMFHSLYSLYTLWLKSKKENEPFGEKTNLMVSA